MSTSPITPLASSPGEGNQKLHARANSGTPLQKGEGQGEGWVALYVGLPFRSLGRDRAGVDCWGLVHLIYREVLRLEVPSYSEDYVTAYDCNEIGELVGRETYCSKWKPIPFGEECVGDVILIRLNGHPSHTGIVIGGRRFLHAREGSNSCIERYDDVRWVRRVLGFYRYAG